MAQILTPYVYDDCEAIVERGGCAVWDLMSLSNNPNYLDLFGSPEYPGERTEAQMLASGLSKAFLDDFPNRVANLWIDVDGNSSGSVFTLLCPKGVSHATTYVSTRFSTSVYYEDISHEYLIKKEQPSGSDEYVYKFIQTSKN